MIRKLPIALVLTMATSTALANTKVADYGRGTSVEETTGLVSGAVVGALAGGPPGAIVGAALGALTGDGIRAKRRLNSMQADILVAEMEVETLRQENQLLVERVRLAQQELGRLRAEGVRAMSAALPQADNVACCHNLALTVHFRTGSSELEPHYQSELQNFIRLARLMPAASIEITGYADRSGEADSNLRLSRQRSANIEAYLEAAGFDRWAITTVAYGDTRPTHVSQSLETDFFDRRVIVRLLDSNQKMLTSNPDAQ